MGIRPFGLTSCGPEPRLTETEQRSVVGLTDNPIFSQFVHVCICIAVMESDSQEDSGSVSDSRKTSIEEHTEDRMTFIISEVDEVNEQSEESGGSDSEDSLEDQLVNSSIELSILERLGLNRVSLTEQDVEAAFAHFSLAFRCDSFTLRRRVQVEERARDVAEENIQQELEECHSLLQKFNEERVSLYEEEIKYGTHELMSSPLEPLTGVSAEVSKKPEERDRIP
ncbi:hypothetical protein NDU88_005399 [Pleurodeles waltl]|uniref:Uncharacterized protein n=1 Tax=Pleurodeles waltl TaxID=8319 RepID=A0AAV7QI74_PLEWA|nr:hypothetical protein NDU88_005399 [Pleurodeles waltl]